MEECVKEFSATSLAIGVWCGAALITLIDVASDLRSRRLAAMEATQPRRGLIYVLVDAAHVDAFCRDNPEMLRAEQCLEIVRAADIALSIFNSALAKATLECECRVGTQSRKVPLFRLIEEKPRMTFLV